MSSSLTATAPFLLTLAINAKRGDMLGEFPQCKPQDVASNWEYPQPKVNILLGNIHNEAFFHWLTDPNRMEKWRAACEDLRKPFPLKPYDFSLIHKPHGLFRGFNPKLAEVEIPETVLLTLPESAVVRFPQSDNLTTLDDCGKKPVVRNLVTVNFRLTTGGGSISIKWQKCGKKKCRCNEGKRHGPYAWKRPEWKCLGKVGSGRFLENCDFYKIDPEEIENLVPNNG